MPRAWRLYAAFVALSLLLGPATEYIVQPTGEALLHHDLAAEALASLAAGLALTLATWRAPARLTVPASRAIWLLLVPHVLTVLLDHGFAPVLLGRPLEWGLTAALALAAPLWLALLAAAQRVEVEVPYTVAVVAIAGLATLLLGAPTDAYAFDAAHIPALVIRTALQIFTVFTWAFAASRFGGLSAAAVAGRFLLLRAAFDGIASVVIERAPLTAVVWHDALLWLALDTVLAAAALLLWFWLFQQMPLAAFALYPLGAWIASILVGIAVFGAWKWQLDAAAALGIAALVVGLRARPADEQPVALELS